jgi:hypothetical protein
MVRSLEVKGGANGIGNLLTAREGGLDFVCEEGLVVCFYFLFLPFLLSIYMSRS